MNPFTSEDQKLVPIPIVDNLISEIHTINSAIKKFSPQRASYHKALNAKSDYVKATHDYSLRDSLRPTVNTSASTNVSTNPVSDRISSLHAKLDESICRSIVTLHRSRSPQRNTVNRTEESPLSRSFYAEQPKSSTLPSNHSFYAEQPKSSILPSNYSFYPEQPKSSRLPLNYSLYAEQPKSSTLPSKYERSSSVQRTNSSTARPYSPILKNSEPYSPLRGYSGSPTRRKDGIEKAKKSVVFSDMIAKDEPVKEVSSPVLSRSTVGLGVSSWSTGLNDKVAYDEQKVNKVICDIIMRNAKLDASPGRKSAVTESSSLYRSYI